MVHDMIMVSQSRFEFIDYTSTSGALHARTDPEARRRARVAVMQDYLRKTRTLEKPLPKSHPSGPPDQYKTRFRLRSREPDPPRDSTAHERAVSYERKPARLPSLHLPMSSLTHHHLVDTCSQHPSTHPLIHYYLRSYWSNSLAVNPTGDWTPITLADPAMVHGKLSLVSLHRADRTTTAGGGLPADHLYHRGRAIALIAQRLAAAEAADGVAVIGAVALLASLDDHSACGDASGDAHLRAVAALVQERGGIDADGIGDPLRRVLGWVDLLRSALAESALVLGLSRTAVMASLDEFRAVAGGQRIKVRRLRVDRARLPWLAQIRGLMRQLLLLMDVKAGIDARSPRKLRMLWSNSVWRLEYDLSTVHELGIVGPWGEQSALRALRDATLICSYANLREQNSQVIFGRLVHRLKGYVSPMVREVRLDLDYLHCDEVSILLWVLCMGWKGSRFAHKNGQWFLMTASAVAVRYAMMDPIFADGHPDGEVEPMCLGLDASEITQLQKDMRNWEDMASMP